MIEALDELYASNTASSRISLLINLYQVKYDNGSMEKHCDSIAALLSQLAKMGPEMAVPETHKGPLLLASIGAETKFDAAVTALRTRNVEELTSEFVATTLIEEARSRSAKSFQERKRNSKRKKKQFYKE